MNATRDGVTPRPRARGGHRAARWTRRCTCTTSRRSASSTSTSSRPTTRPPYAEDGDTLARRRGVAAGRRGRPAGRAEPRSSARSTRRTSRPWSRELGDDVPRHRRARCSGCSTTAATFVDEASAHTDETMRPARQRADRAADPGGPEREHPLLLPRPGPASPRRSRTATRTCAPRPPGHARRPRARSTRCSRTSSRRCRCCSANAVSVNQVVVAHLAGLEQLLVIFPHVIAAGFTGTPGRRLRPRQPAARHSGPAVHQGLQAARTSGGRPATSPTPRSSRPSAPAGAPFVHARHAVLARAAGNGSPGRGLPGRLRPRHRHRRRAWSTRTATRCTSSTRATCRSWETTRGSGCWSVRWWRRREPASSSNVCLYVVVMLAAALLVVAAVRVVDDDSGPTSLPVKGVVELDEAPAAEQERYGDVARRRPRRRPTAFLNIDYDDAQDSDRRGRGGRHRRLPRPVRPGHRRRRSTLLQREQVGHGPARCSGPAWSTSTPTAPP